MTNRRWLSGAHANAVGGRLLPILDASQYYYDARCCSMGTCTAGRLDTYDAKSGLPFWLIAPTHLLPEAPGLVRACGSLDSRLYLGAIGLFYAGSMETVARP